MLGRLGTTAKYSSYHYRFILCKSMVMSGSESVGRHLPLVLLELCARKGGGRRRG